ncbi:Imm59 family immunity protein [Microbacterium testaceum]|uniref:Imm59 family immunity protein n=1 Tax=Microbacterium testaceum TaxID=2033 RepID=UPI001D178DDA|nr:Imm59 family immunity protein [Microbacterium testaceum]MCC4247649.1 hypothetical protein [Microbacterium testaceum]
MIDPRNERARAQQRDETLVTIRAEGLGGYRWFEDATNATDIVAIQRTESGWVVFATDERATVEGRREFTAEEPALEHFLSRLRSSNSVAAWREKVRRENAPRYFVRELRVDGQLIPARLFRRRETDLGPVDEFLVDVDRWGPRYARSPGSRHPLSPGFRPRGDLGCRRERDLRDGRAARIHPADRAVSR